MYSIRKAELKDIPTIVEFRIEMFRSFSGDAYDYDAIRGHEIPWFEEALTSGDFAAWVAENENGTIIASSGISFYELTPKPWNMDGKYGFVSSMYTSEDYRRKGIGGKLLQTALDYSKSVGVDWVTLHASESGKSLYQSFGFKQTNEMRMKLSTASDAKSKR